MVKSHCVYFLMGTWTPDVTLDGRHIRFRCDLKADNWITELQTSKNQENEEFFTTIERVFNHNEMKVKMSVNDVVSYSTFIRTDLNENTDKEKLF